MTANDPRPTPDGDTRLPDFVAAVRPLFDRGLVALDFDGTLAPIVRDPESSRCFYVLESR